MVRFSEKPSGFDVEIGMQQLKVLAKKPLEIASEDSTEKLLGIASEDLTEKLLEIASEDSTEKLVDIASEDLIKNYLKLLLKIRPKTAKNCF